MHPEVRKVRPLGFWAVVALIFFEVAGGPFGIEDSVRYGGATLALMGLLILPVIWSIPEALVTAELGTMFPEDSGYVAWVTAAFGPFWGFQGGFLSWISGVIDNSIYPLYLARYLKWFIPILDQTVPQKLFLVMCSVAMTYLNYRGLKVVGRTAVVLTIFILCPFIVLTCLGAHDVDTSNWFASANHETKDFVAFINVMFWNLNYWDSVSTLAGEIGEVKSVLPRALLTAVVLVCMTYLVPLLLGVGILGSSDWPEGFFAYLGKKVSGVWLEGWITLSAVASQMGLFTAELSGDTYMLLGLAERGMLPKILAEKSRYGTPTLALLLSCSGITFMLMTSNFESTVEMLNAVYCFSELLEFCALIKLRICIPEYPRPFKIPLSVPAMIAMLVPCSLFAVGIIVAPFITLDWPIMGFTVACLILGIAVYHFLEYTRNRSILKFNRMQFAVISTNYEPLSDEESVAEASNEEEEPVLPPTEVS